MPYFSKKYTTTSNIAASATSTEQIISVKDADENGPFDSIDITNDDVVALGINLNKNTDNRIVVLPNSMKPGKDLNFRDISISNLDSSNAHTAGKVHIIVENTKTPRKK